MAQRVVCRVMCVNAALWRGGRAVVERAGAVLARVVITFGYEQAAGWHRLALCITPANVVQCATSNAL
jgi:hypothetical protein